jgi:cation:H+ antiporter
VTLFLFAVGMILLFAGGDALVRGAVGVARRYRVPPLVIGLTIVGFGTSTPELLVSVAAALEGQPAIAVGNVIGSNIGNVLLILGLSAAITPVPVGLRPMARDFAFMIGATLVLWAMIAGGLLGRVEGLALLVGLAVYIWLCLRDDGAPAGETPAGPGLALSILFILGGLAGLMVGANLLVDSATAIARTFGISEAVIGLTIVAVGTSLPELATSLVAAIRRHPEIALGNVVGSNIYNIMGILALTAVVSPIPVEGRFIRVDMWWVLGSGLAVIALAALAGRVSRIAGAALLAAYAVYVVTLVA